MSAIENCFSCVNPARFRYVHLNKLDERGGVRTFDGISELRSVEEIATGDLYIDDEPYVVAIKCALLIPGTPLLCVSKIIWHVLSIPINMICVAFETICLIGAFFQSGSKNQAFALFKTKIVQIAVNSKESILEVVKAPFYAIAMIAVAPYGIFNPYQARKIEAAIEKSWNHGISYKDENVFYLATCFQVRGNLLSAPARYRILSHPA